VSAVISSPIASDAELPRGVGLRWVQLRAVFGFSLRVALQSKRLWILGLVTFLPVLVPLGYAIVSIFIPHVPPFPSVMGVFRNLFGLVYLRVVLYVLAMAYGLSLLSDEIEGKTLIHLVLRPIPRWTVVGGKFLSSWLVAGVLIVLSVIVTYALLWAIQKDPGVRLEAFRLENLKTLGIDLVAVVGALAAYLALFSCVGAWLPHGERWGVVFCFGWESLITYLPARLKWITLMYHVQTLIPNNVVVVKRFILSGEPLPKYMCVMILFAATVVFLALTVWNLKRREIR